MKGIKTVWKNPRQWYIANNYAKRLYFETFDTIGVLEAGELTYWDISKMNDRELLAYWNTGKAYELVKKYLAVSRQKNFDTA